MDKSYLWYFLQKCYILLQVEISYGTLPQTQVASKFEWGNYENCESSIEAVEFLKKTKMIISLAK